MLLILVSARLALAWGALGHQLTGQIATAYLSKEAKEAVDALLPARWYGNLSRACTWADEIKGRRYYAWSSKLHYIDCQVDMHARICSVDLDRDCRNGACIVGAIYNYTERLDPGNGYPLDQQAEALRFLIHFVGDMAQPLHASGIYRGGNDWHVIFDNRTSHLNGMSIKRPYNMHSIWDSSIMEKDIREHHGGQVSNYIKSIMYDLEYGQWEDEKYDWIECKSPYVTRSGRSTPACAVEWAKISNALNCETVWVGVEPRDKVDLGGEYYRRNAPILRKTIAQGGIRMAALLNSLFANESDDAETWFQPGRFLIVQ
ncbi:S1/P1 nuclease [Polychytrium aggregatum]|uniref:S1/P1 nuclease n=1 Tax=Polychytrium aggregatum TaxID=110093 RepID=UPI0022FE8E95|nr:S1/P1 nuclease [Polychytrium aggregatum]KAI9202766.1 S1/P1 nuclease [Polychytrium aggregatum]